MGIDHHALLLAGGGQTVTGDGYARRNDDEKLYSGIGSGQFERGGIVGVRKSVGEADVGLARAEGIGDGVVAFAFVDGGLRNGHAHGGGGGDRAESALFRNGEFKVSFGAEERGGRLRGVLNGVFLGAHELAVLGFEDDDVRFNGDGFWVLGDFVDLDFDFRATWRSKGIEADVVIGGADEDRAPCRWHLW